MNNSRSKNGMRNLLISSITSVLTVLLSFINRTVFIKYLSEDYLGLNGLFSNVLGFLSLTELGIGVAINFALYEPLKKHDTEKLKSLMQLYKKLYTIIGICFLILGTIIAPFLKYLIKDMPENIPHIHIYFLLFVINSGVSYFCTYRRSLIICDQKEYISIVTLTIAKTVLIVLQLIILVLTRSFLFYTLAAIAVTIAENLVISHIANRMYPFLKDKNAKPLSEEEKSSIKKNVLALVFHNIGGVIVFSSDNIIISKFVGLIAVGFYSNYTLIITSVDRILRKIFSTLTASVGNLIVSDKDDTAKIEKIFYRMLYANMCLYGLSSICFLVFMEPFITLWIGQKFVLPLSVLLTAVISFYFNGMRRTVLVFKDASGLFRQDKYKPLIESAVNIAASIPLALKFGITGVLLGTILSTLIVPFWFEAYVLFRVSFRKSFLPYMLMQLKYLLIITAAALICRYCWSLIPGDGISMCAVKLLLTLLISALILILTTFRTEEFRYFVSIIRKKK